MGRLTAFLIALLCAAPLLAQDAWRVRKDDSGTYLIGSVYNETARVGFGCTAPSPQGRPAIETGSYEMHVSKPYEAGIGFPDDMFNWAPPYRQDNVIIAVDGAGYRLPPFHLDELRGTAVVIPMADNLMLSLLRARSLVLYPGTGKAHTLSTEGLAAGLTDAFGYCARRWAALGVPMPEPVAQFAGVAAQPPQGLRAKAEAAIAQACGGPADLGPSAITLGNIDGDGVDDVLVDYGQLSCAQGVPRPFCGAARCSAEIYLSARARPYDLIVLGANLIPLSNGLQGVAVGAGQYECGDTVGCQIIYYWNGTDMVKLP